MHSQAPLAELQRQAVEWQDGPLLVLAAPGSGRTHVLARRVVRLLDASRAVVEQARRRIGADRTAAPRVLDCFAGGEVVMRP